MDVEIKLFAFPSPPILSPDPVPELEEDDWEENDDDDPPEIPDPLLIGVGGERITLVITPPLPSLPEDDDEELCEVWKLLLDPPLTPVPVNNAPPPKFKFKFPRLNPFKSSPCPDPELVTWDVTVPVLDPPVNPVANGVPDDVCVVV